MIIAESRQWGGFLPGDTPRAGAGASDSGWPVLPERARYLYVHQGLKQVEVEQARAGEIIALAVWKGSPSARRWPTPRTRLRCDHPGGGTDGTHVIYGEQQPFAGREGRWSTTRKLRERLFEELRTNVALRVSETDSTDTFLVSGRGELHLAILIETMRREGYEFQVSRPEVILRKGEQGETLEPFEEVFIETDPETVGVWLRCWAAGVVRCWTAEYVRKQCAHQIPGADERIAGFRYQFLTATRGAV